MSQQYATADFFTRNSRAFCFNDMGTGKTLSALWAADYLMDVGLLKGKCIIVTTLSTVESIWAHELYLSFQHRTYAVLTGSKKRRQKLLLKDVDFYIINHDGIKVLWGDLHERDDITHYIIDEGAVFRNKSTDRWFALNHLCGLTSCAAHGDTGALPARGANKTVWWLTGSPTPEQPTDIWAQVRLVKPDNVPAYFSRFRSMIMTERSAVRFEGAKSIPFSTYTPKKGWERIVHEVTQPAIRFKRDECMDLPPCTTQTRVVSMSAEQAKAYKEMLAHYFTQLKTGHIQAVNEGVKVMKLAQLACGTVYDKEGVAHELDCKPKLDALMDAIDEAGGKAIVFTSFKHSTAMLAKHIGKKYSVAVVNGDVGLTERTKIFNDFQMGDLQVLLAHPQVCAHGLNLTASSTIIWFSPINRHEIYEQAVARITRAGQDHPQFIIQIVCAPIEEKIYRKLETKEKMQGILLDLFQKEGVK